MASPAGFAESNYQRRRECVITVVLGCCIAALCLFTVSVPVIASEKDDADTSPRTRVDELHKSLIAAMKMKGDDGYGGRFKLLHPVIRKNFDIPLVSRLVLGGAWAKLSAEQQGSFSDLMARYMTANYASKFKDHSGQSFTFKSETPQGERVMIVRAEFRSNSKTRKFDYQVRKGSTGWKIVNVAVDGISDLSLKRAEFGDVLKDKGFDGLVEQMRTRITEMAEGKE